MIKIHLTKEDRELLLAFISKGTAKARAIVRANILLLLDEGKSDEEITSATKASRQKIWRTKKRFLEVGLPLALNEKPRSGQPKVYHDKQETEIIAMACTKAPNGRKRWTLKLLTEKLHGKEGFSKVNRESVRLILKKTKLNLG